MVKWLFAGMSICKAVTFLFVLYNPHSRDSDPCSDADSESSGVKSTEILYLSKSINTAM